MRSLLVFAFLFATLPAYATGPVLTKLDVVILDPGHGGEDVGAIAGDNTEKETCLKLAQAIKELIEKQNGTSVKVVLTAAPDKGADQRERAFVANSNKGKLFLSLHAGASLAGRQRGMGIYIPDFPEGKGVTWKEAGKRHLQKSAQFAERLKAALDGAFPGNRSFLAKGPLALFHGVAMPAAAVEAVDMSRPPAAEELAKIAEAVYSAMVEFDGRL